ncbi:guanylate cyclase activator 1 [Sarotherodon galilaeus]
MSRTPVLQFALPGIGLLGPCPGARPGEGAQGQASGGRALVLARHSPKKGPDKSFLVGDGLHQGCPLSPILFVIFMDRISRRSQVAEGFHLGGLRISSLLFTDDVVLLASLDDGLQLAVEPFTAKCEAVGMRISTSKSEAMVLTRKRVECPLWVRDEFLPQVEEFKYLGALFTSDGRREREIDRRIGATAAVMHKLCTVYFKQLHSSSVCNIL